MGEASGAELLVGAVEELLRGGMGAGACGFEGHRGREGFNHAAMDGGGGFAVKLLIDDALDEGFEGRLCACDAQSEWPCTFDEFTELGIVRCEFATGESAVVAWRAWIVAMMRHLLTVSQGGEESLASGYEFGLDWFAFTSEIRFGQGRYSGHFRPMKCDARDVVQTLCGKVR